MKPADVRQLISMIYRFDENSIGDVLRMLLLHMNTDSRLNNQAAARRAGLCSCRRPSRHHRQTLRAMAALLRRVRWRREGKEEREEESLLLYCNGHAGKGQE